MTKVEIISSKEYLLFWMIGIMTNHFRRYGSNVVNTNMLHIEVVEVTTKQISCLRCLACQSWLSGMKGLLNFVMKTTLDNKRYSWIIWIPIVTDAVMVCRHLSYALIVKDSDVGFCCLSVNNFNRWLIIRTKLYHISSDVNDSVLSKVMAYDLLTNIFGSCVNIEQRSDIGNWLLCCCD